MSCRSHVTLSGAIERKVDRSNARVVRGCACVGSAAGIVPESLSFAFRVVCEGTRTGEWPGEIDNVRQSFLASFSA
jgi:Zn finger protein HypA/HybF involved in hydrogenase expression